MDAALPHARTLYDYMRLGHEPVESDVMMVFGSIDLDVAAYAAELWHGGYSRSGRVILSGGVAHTDDLLATGWADTEARVFAREMIRQWVPESALVLEERAANSGENVRYSADIVARDFPDARDFLIVHKPYMERRALATWEAQYPGPYDGVRVVSRPETCDDYLARTGMDFERFADILVGDTTRMERYAALGYQSDQAPLPTPVRTALDALIRLGYDRHLPEK